MADIIEILGAKSRSMEKWGKRAMWGAGAGTALLFGGAYFLPQNTPPITSIRDMYTLTREYKAFGILVELGAGLELLSAATSITSVAMRSRYEKRKAEIAELRAEISRAGYQ